MIGEKIFDCREMFRHACTFVECANLALNKLQHDTAPIGFYSIPSVVNYSFACEVFLKAILVWYEVPPRKQHELLELYQATPQSVQDSIKNITQNNYAGQWTNVWGIEYLEQLSNSFAKCRYLYEHNFSQQGSVHIEVGFLVAFCKALREVCCKLFYSQTWEEFATGQLPKGEQNG